MDQLFSVSGEIVVITGGMGQLGRSYATAFLERGAKVAILDLQIDGDMFNSHFGSWKQQGKAIGLSCDILNKKRVQECADEIINLLGTPTVLINNAALDSPPDATASENGPFEDYPEISFEKVMDVNVKGTFLCCQVFGGLMAKGIGGSIINISSIYGMVSPDQSLYEYRRQKGEAFYKPASYAVSKSAIFNLTRYLAVYWGKKNVRVNTLTLAGVFNNQDSSFLTAYCGRIPVGRMAESTEYNGAVVFLASKASAYMTGSNLIVDGGWTSI